MLEAVLFDWGGTLMQDEWSDEIALEGHTAGIAALRRDGLPTAEAFTVYLREHEAELFGHTAEDEIDIAAVMRTAFERNGVDLADDDLRLFLTTVHDVWASYYRLAASTHALLDALRGRGLRLGLVSNTASPEWLLRPVLERQGLVERVDSVVLSSEVGKRKPHPAIFRRALDELGVEPAAALFVGDRLGADVLGASRAGMRTVQALWFRADDVEVDVEPDFQAFTQMDVLNVVDRLRARP
ncbi:MAG TPA: HAD family hydrolase [Gaiellaceae bacterium]|nr:HAD family hydrolase [Gaiellaceae bacterium]